MAFFLHALVLCVSERSRAGGFPGVAGAAEGHGFAPIAGKAVSISCKLSRTISNVIDILCQLKFFEVFKLVKS